MIGRWLPLLPAGDQAERIAYARRWIRSAPDERARAAARFDLLRYIVAKLPEDMAEAEMAAVSGFLADRITQLEGAET